MDRTRTPFAPDIKAARFESFSLNAVTNVDIRGRAEVQLSMLCPDTKSADAMRGIIGNAIHRVSSPPRWSPTMPTEPGYYWWRLDAASAVYVHDLKPREIEIDRQYPDERSGLWWSERIQEPPR